MTALKPDKNFRRDRRKPKDNAAPLTERYSDYDPFAEAYERYWCDEVPPQIFTVIERLLLPRIARRSRILDLCCGTGYTVARLEKLGYRVTGVDGSRKMLARARARSARHSTFLLADARSINLAPLFDAVVSTFDSLNHMMTLDELEAVMKNVHCALAPTGFFFFDMNMERGFLDHWASYFSIVDKDGACILRGEYDQRARTGRYDITIFRRRRNVWRRSDAVIKEKCYLMREIKGALRKAGFESVTLFDAVRDFGLTDQTGRKFFLARKDA